MYVTDGGTAETATVDWSNKGFLQTAFTASAQALIETSELDNSAASTNPASNPKQWGEGENKHACENTSDKIFLLSEKEATTSDYGFPEFNVHGAGNARIRATTDYAKANYAYQDTASNGWWWLRSPYWTGSSEAYGIENGGNAEGRHAPVSRKHWGVVPALRITLP